MADRQESADALLARLDERSIQNRVVLEDLAETVRPLPAKLNTLNQALLDHMADEVRLREADRAEAKRIADALVVSNATRVTRHQMLLTSAGLVVTALLGLVGLLVRGHGG